MHIDCPRCGYDMRGVIASWRESCPLEGVCSECGYAFAWGYRAEVRYEPKWGVEFGNDPGEFSHRALGTLIRSILPWRLWREMSLRFPLRRRRLVAYGMLQLLPLLMLYVIAQSFGAILLHTRTVIELEAQYYDLPARIARAEAFQRSIERGESFMPNRTRSEQLAFAQEQVDRVKGMVGQTPATNISYAGAIVRAIVFPLGKKSGVTMSDGSAYPGPRSAARVARLPLSKPHHRWYIDKANEAATRLLAAWSIVVLVPVLLLLVTRVHLQPRVRGAHLLRISVYGLFVPVGMTLLWIGVYVTGLAWPLYAWSIPHGLHTLATWAFPLTLWLWWWAAGARYLKLPHAWLITGLFTLLASLLVLSPVTIMQDVLR